MSMGSRVEQAINSAISFLSRGQNTERQYSFDSPFMFEMEEGRFVRARLTHLYSKILRDCFNRSAGIRDDIKPLFWDTVVNSYGKSKAGSGLISLLAESMADCGDLFLIYQNGVLRTAAPAEIQSIKDAFMRGHSKRAEGFWFSFSNYELSGILKILLGLEFAVMANSYTGLNVSNAVQLKISKLRELISDSERVSPVEQARAVVEGLKAGKSVLLDSMDIIDTTKIDMAPADTAIKFINGLKAEALNMPLSYVNGELASGLSTTGESDAIAVERGIEGVFNSVFKPSVDEIFNIQITFASENWRVLQTSATALQAISYLSDDLVPIEVKQRLAESILKDFYRDGEHLSESGR